MTRVPESNWLSDLDRGDVNTSDRSENFGPNNQGKPLKAVIGVAILVVFALVLSHMNPVPHDVPSSQVTTGQSATDR